MKKLLFILLLFSSICQAQSGAVPLQFIIVNGAANPPPTVSAGSNQSITGTAGTLTGTASGNGGATIASYSWVRTSGPNTPTITSPTSATTSVSGLITGTYVFTLTATDSRAVSASSSVTWTVSTASYTVLNQIDFNFRSQFGSEPSPSPYWNGIGVATSALVTDSSFTKTSGIVDIANTAMTGWQLVVNKAFSGGSTESEPTPTTANSGIFVDLIERSAFIRGGFSDPDPSIVLKGIPAGTWLQIYCYSNNSAYRTPTLNFYVGTNHSNSITSISPQFGTAGDPLTSSYIAYIKNVQVPSSGRVEIFQQMTAGSSAAWTAMIVQVTNIANPN